jgi:drug/metabolite transporter (DMT)-like permease
MLFAAALFVAMDSVAKYLGQYYATSQLVWARYSVHLLVLFGYLIVSKNLNRRTLISNAPLGQLLRGFLLLGSTAFSYLAVREFPLTQVYVINFSSPIIVTVFAIIILKEHVGLGRILAILSGFLGVIVAIEPGRMFVEPALIYPILMAVCFAFYQITTRHFGNQDSALTSLLYTAAAGGVVSTFLILFVWQPIAYTHIAYFLALGLLGATSHFLLIMALRFAPAAQVSPFLYSQILWATVSGYLFFGDLPDSSSFVGAALVVGAGLYLIVWDRGSTTK